jgi:hypothetical protein
LGLSVEWAGWNVGANSPEEYGGYYSWGETEEWDGSYEHLDDDAINNLKYIGNEISGTKYDVAHVKWGGGARMPVCKEIRELQLCNRITWNSDSYSGFFIVGTNGNSIFLPRAGFKQKLSSGGVIHDEGMVGYYYAGTLHNAQSLYEGACGFRIQLSLQLFCNDSRGRTAGYSVRPVRDKQ